MKDIISRESSYGTKTVRKGDLPLCLQRTTKGELDDIVEVHTFDHVDTIEFYEARGRYNIGDNLKDETAYRDHIVTGKINTSMGTRYTAVSHTP